MAEDFEGLGALQILRSETIALPTGSDHGRSDSTLLALCRRHPQPRLQSGSKINPPPPNAARCPAASLRDGTDEVTQALKTELPDPLEKVGVAVEEARLTHLAYAPEIAQAMLRRQQAEAVIAARQKIAHGAVSMVEMALRELSEKNVVQLDDERKAAMVSNLLVVLCGESEVSPVVNTGTLYS